MREHTGPPGAWRPTAVEIDADGHREHPAGPPLDEVAPVGTSHGELIRDRPELLAVEAVVRFQR